MAPFDLTSLAGTVSYALVFGAIGFAFGAVLELAGFGDTRKLAAQFYLRDLTVLKTMFTAIVVAALLLFLSSSLGVLDLSRVWVNPTYLWPGIVGGLVMGVGFVVGGFCPGTSLVAAATLKLDGILFVAGALLGVHLFGETVASFEPFWLSSYLGKLTLPELFGLSTGATLVLVVSTALVLFRIAEWAEGRFAPAAAAPPPGRRSFRRAGAVALAAAAIVVAARGQPSAEDRYRASPALQSLVRERAPFVHPAEVVALRKDVNVRVEILDLRSEHEFNLFHVGGSRRVEPADLATRAELRRLEEAPAFAATFLVSRGEDAALAAWKRLAALGISNVYVVEGGVDRWLELYPPPACAAERAPGGAAATPAWRFAYATGSRLPSARPELPVSSEFRLPCADGSDSPGTSADLREHVWPEHAFTKRVELRTRSVVKGGCG